MKEEFDYCRIDLDSITAQFKTVSPEDIVDFVKSSDKYEPSKSNDIVGDVIETVPNKNKGDNPGILRVKDPRFIYQSCIITGGSAPFESQIFKGHMCSCFCLQ